MNSQDNPRHDLAGRTPVQGRHANSVQQARRVIAHGHLVDGNNPPLCKSRPRETRMTKNKRARLPPKPSQSPTPGLNRSVPPLKRWGTPCGHRFGPGHRATIGRAKRTPRPDEAAHGGDAAAHGGDKAACGGDAAAHGGDEAACGGDAAAHGVVYEKTGVPRHRPVNDAARSADYGNGNLVSR
jgi:hypothetical protein